ncbi:hypothetical protein LAD73_02785 [Mycoplasma sp. 1331]|uniref:Lipoprotein n=1 Tax=Mycoplasma tauri TaxID=547987 RepID=A0A953ND25_9MOLU|nr:hypothetical protein [Mycoplasma tauri]MBZ4195627.1 hypothetical protein [Mycoplasma tauri]
MKNKKLYFGIAGIASTIIPMAVISVSCGKKSAKDEYIDLMRKSGVPQEDIDEIIKLNLSEEQYRKLIEVHKADIKKFEENNKMQNKQTQNN